MPVLEDPHPSENGSLSSLHPQGKARLRRPHGEASGENRGSQECQEECGAEDRWHRLSGSTSLFWQPLEFELLMVSQSQRDRTQIEARPNLLPGHGNYGNGPDAIFRRPSSGSIRAPLETAHNVGWNRENQAFHETGSLQLDIESFAGICIGRGEKEELLLVLENHVCSVSDGQSARVRDERGLTVQAGHLFCTAT